MTLPSTPPFMEDFPHKKNNFITMFGRQLQPCLMTAEGKKTFPTWLHLPPGEPAAKGETGPPPAETSALSKGIALWNTDLLYLHVCVYIFIYCIVYIHFYSRNLILCHKYITYPALSDDSSFSMVETSEINLDPSGIIACLSACMSWQQYVLVHIYIYIFNICVRCVYIYICCKLAPK